MYERFYTAISKPFRQSARTTQALAAVDKLLVALFATSFIGVAIWLALHQDSRTIRYLAVCAISFVALSALRAGLNQPRPYERFDIKPLIPKDTQGKSFPSRHVFSAAVITCALLWLNTWLGVTGLAATAILGATRIIGGVHFPRDVIVGAALGIASGILGFWII